MIKKKVKNEKIFKEVNRNESVERGERKNVVFKVYIRMFFVYFIVCFEVICSSVYNIGG